MTVDIVFFGIWALIRTGEWISIEARYQVEAKECVRIATSLNERYRTQLAYAAFAPYKGTPYDKCHGVIATARLPNRQRPKWPTSARFIPGPVYTCDQ
jgi:hypothetical protein